MNLFDLTGKKGLVIGGEGNLGPIWMETLRDAGAEAYSLGLPHFDFSDLGEIKQAFISFTRSIMTLELLLMITSILLSPASRPFCAPGSLPAGPG